MNERKDGKRKILHICLNCLLAECMTSPKQVIKLEKELSLRNIPKRKMNSKYQFKKMKKK